MLSYSYYSTAFFNFKAKDGFFTKNSVYAHKKTGRNTFRCTRLKLRSHSTVFKLISMSVNSSPET